jgi:hypothetical protein
LEYVSRNSQATLQLRFYCLKKYLEFIGKADLLKGIKIPKKQQIKVKASDLLTREDVSSEILTLAVEQGIVKPDKFDKLSPNQKKKIELLKSRFKAYWEDLYTKIGTASTHIKSIDMKTFLKEREFIQKMYEERAEYWQSQYLDKMFVR